MECVMTEEPPPAVAVDQNTNNEDSAENFQKFIYELFEKNGVLNDLRAYLRGHIVNLLKSAQTGNPPLCQKYFTQRLELRYQALNMLIAEYLLCLEFSYSFSVFISEIPLANMVFQFAKTLLQNSDIDNMKLRFTDADVWSILNYLGVKCDSEHAHNIVESYKNENSSPLLLCILMCTPMYRKGTVTVQENSSLQSLSSTAQSSDSSYIKEKTSDSKKNSSHDKCKHFGCCKTCQSRISRMKEKYKKKKRNLSQTIKRSPVNPLNVEFMKNISVVERTLIDEMFQQLQSVYEAEVEMLKKEEEKKLKRSLATHAIQLRKQQEEMEQTFKIREAELERSVHQKKKFLWGLARALRDQHAQMSRAMSVVRDETERLTTKEDNLKTQLLEAESVLKKRGEEMRIQISQELIILENHLESMKRERDNLNRERSEIENLKTACDSQLKMQISNEEMRTQYDLIKNELRILKNYLETSKLESKSVTEKSTLTDLNNVTSRINIVLNNEQEVDRNLLKCDNDGRVGRSPNRVVNNLKKQKNVNFGHSHLDVTYNDHNRGRDRDRSRSSASSDAGDAEPDQMEFQQDYERDRDILQQLHNENIRLKNFARQQRQRIDELCQQRARLQAELTAARAEAAGLRPRTAPPQPAQPHYFLQRLNTSASANTFGWRKGAGEELNVFTTTQPQILVPGDDLPFVGILRDRHNDNRRYLINQWRSLRRRMSPLGGVCKRGASSPHRDRLRDRPVSAGPTLSTFGPAHEEDSGAIRETSEEYTSKPNTTKQSLPKTETHSERNRGVREKSPKSLLREAKQNLRNKDTVRSKKVRETTREKSPNSVLREAKLRLKKLEIEAEAVEKSYLDFRKRQNELRGRSNIHECVNDIMCIGKNIEAKRSKSLQNLDDNYRLETNAVANYKQAEKCLKNDLEIYLNHYQTHFKNKRTSEIAKQTPEKYSKMQNLETEHLTTESINNYLETPLIEFRKLYHSHQPSAPSRKMAEARPDKLENNEDVTQKEKDKPETHEATLNIHDTEPHNSKKENDREAEFKILKENITKIYNLKENTLEPEPESEKKAQLKSKEIDNNLRIEVESVNETSNLKLTESEPQDLLLVVQSSVDARNMSSDEKEKISPQMTIIVSPKMSSPRGPESSGGDGARTPSIKPLDQTEILTPNDVLNAIFHASNNEQVSSSEMQILPKEDVEYSISECEKDYIDDFSADVDNYNSRSDENNSPISLPKTSEDENFWDS